MKCSLGAACHEGARIGLDPSLSSELREWRYLDLVQQERKEEIARECVYSPGPEKVAHMLGWVWAVAEQWQRSYCTRFSGLARAGGDVISLGRPLPVT